MDSAQFHCIDMLDDLEGGQWKYAWIWTILMKVFNGLVLPAFHWIVREAIQMIFATKLMRPSGTIRNKCGMWFLGFLWRVFTTLGCYGSAVIINSWIEQYYPNRYASLYKYSVVISLIMFQYMIEWFVNVLSDDRFEQIETRFEQIETRFEVLFRHLGIPDPVNPASPELLIEIEENINNWKIQQESKLKKA